MQAVGSDPLVRLIVPALLIGRRLLGGLAGAPGRLAPVRAVGDQRCSAGRACRLRAGAAPRPAPAVQPPARRQPRHGVGLRRALADHAAAADRLAVVGQGQRRNLLHADPADRLHVDVPALAADPAAVLLPALRHRHPALGAGLAGDQRSDRRRAAGDVRRERARPPIPARRLYDPLQPHLRGGVGRCHPDLLLRDAVDVDAALERLDQPQRGLDSAGAADRAAGADRDDDGDRPPLPRPRRRRAPPPCSAVRTSTWRSSRSPR